MDGTTGFSSGDEVEADLDVEWSGGVAKNATILICLPWQQFDDSNVFNALEFAIDNNLAPVISTSYGNCEANLGRFTAICGRMCSKRTARADRYGGLWRLRGGRLRNQRRNDATHGLAVDAPASIPEVTADRRQRVHRRLSELDRQQIHRRPPNPPYWLGTTGGIDQISSAQMLHSRNHVE